MNLIRKKWISWLVLLTFTFQFIFVDSYEQFALKRLLTIPFRIVSSVLSPADASAETAPDPSVYIINVIPGSFVDISASGNKLVLGDQGGIAGIPTGFDFNFYGSTYNTITVTSNGYITFSTLVSYQNTSIPSTQTPNSLIAPFWAHLNPSLNSAGGVYYQTMGTAPKRKFIVQWDKVPLVSDPNSRLTFEVILFEGSNEIQYQYYSMVNGSGTSGSGPASGSSASIGIENADGTKGEEVSFNQEGIVTAGSAYSFTMGGNAFAEGRLLGDLDGDDRITILDQSALVDMIMGTGKPYPSSELLLSDIAPQPGTNGRAFGDGKIDELDHQRLFEVIMGRAELNPTLSGISNSSASAGETVVLYGSGFDCVASNNTVVFTDIDGTKTTAIPISINAGCTELTVAVPAGMTYITSISIERNNLPSNELPFVLASVPVITELSPDTGKVGTPVLIRGYEFGATPGDNLVKFNGIPATVNSVSTLDDLDELNVTVPAGASTGPVTVTVGGKTSNGKVFTVEGPPIVSIDTPSDNSEITALTNIIGTATDLKLVSYTLKYAPLGEANFVTFATGTSPVNNGVLGTFDPTMLLNGLYTIRLSATDADGYVSSTEVIYRVKGDMKVGNFSITIQDLAIPVAGIPITINRTYDSRDKGSHDFGYGWSIDVQTTKVKENGTPGLGWEETSSGGSFPTYYLNPVGELYVTVTLPDGRMEEFDVRTDPEYSQFVPFEMIAFTLKFVPRPGTTSTLRPAVEPQLYLSGSMILDLDTLEPYDPDRYILTTLDGTEYQIDQRLGLLDVTDTNGNSLTFNSNGILHSSGKSVIFTRDGQGRITKITDPMGKAINYGYDAGGDLVSVTDRDSNITQYTYNSTHGLIDIIDPLGRRPLRNEYDASGRLVAHIDSDGNRIEYTHNIGTRQEIVKDRLGNITVFEYDNKGRVVSKTDPLGNKTTYTYDEVGNKLAETDPLGKTTTWTYDAKKNKLSETKKINGQSVTTRWTYNSMGKILTTTDPLSNVTTNTYDTGGNLLTTRDPLGNVTTNTYDASGNLISTADSLGKTTTYEYDVYGNRTKQIDPLGKVTTYTYDANGNKLTETDPRGGITRYTYDSSNRQTSVKDPLGNISSTEYDKAGNVSARVDGVGNRTTFVYNPSNKLTQTNYPDGTSTSVGYDAEGNRTSTTDQQGRITYYQYNADKQLIQITYPDYSTQSYGYDAAGRQITATDALGNTTTKVYDSLGRVIQSIDPMGNVTLFGYDLAGNQISQTDADNETTTFVYDANNRQIQTILAGGQTTTITYDGAGRKTFETDAAGKATQFSYDAKGNLIAVTDALNNVTQYEYDANGNRTAIIDANGHRTTFAYDLANRMTSKTMPNGGVETYTYDAAGRQITKTDALNHTINYAYDTRGRLTTKTYPDNTKAQFTYTLTGKRLTAVDQRGTTGYDYDSRDRIRQMTYPDGQAVSYTYTQNGHLHTISSLAGTIEYIYNCCRMKEVHDPQGHVTTITYDPAGNRTGLAYPNGTNVAYIYDINNRLTELTYQNSIGQILASYTYTLGPTGNRTRIDESSGIIRQYEYDDIYRLTKEQVTDPQNIETYTSDYTYDAVGNRLNKTHAITGPTDYTYNNADELVTESGVTYTYDLNGNLKTKADATGTTTYTYDYDNRLTSVAAPTGTVSYKYDVDGNRVETTTGSGTTRYLVDTNRQLAQVLAEYTPSNTLIASYVYADDPISMTRNSQTYYYHFDGLGSTRLLTNSAGTVTDVYNYDVFGNLIAGAGNTENPFLFTGQQYDVNNGFYYLRARYYQPTTGRFTALDPFEGDPYAPLSLHKYLYAGDDPVNKIDPSGEQFDLGSIMVAMSIMSILSSIATPSYAGMIPKKRCSAKLCIRPLQALPFVWLAVHCYIEVKEKIVWNFNDEGVGIEPKPTGMCREVNCDKTDEDLLGRINNSQNDPKWASGTWCLFSHNCCHWAINMLNGQNPWYPLYTLPGPDKGPSSCK